MTASRWYPIVLAGLASAVHFALVGVEYWAAFQKLPEAVRRELQVPLFEASGFCGMWTHYSPRVELASSLNGPAFVVATLVHSAVTGTWTCVDAVMHPRGQMFVYAIGLLVWNGVGWVDPQRWRLRVALFVLVVGVVGLAVRAITILLRLVTLGFWMVCGALACYRGVVSVRGGRPAGLPNERRTP